MGSYPTGCEPCRKSVPTSTARRGVCCSAGWRTGLPSGTGRGATRALGQGSGWQVSGNGAGVLDRRRPKLVATSSARNLHRAVAEVRDDLLGQIDRSTSKESARAAMTRNAYPSMTEATVSGSIAAPRTGKDRTPRSAIFVPAFPTSSEMDVPAVRLILTSTRRDAPRAATPTPDGFPRHSAGSFVPAPAPPYRSGGPARQ